MLRGSTLKTLEGAVGGEGIAANMSTTINGDLGIGGMRDYIHRRVAEEQQ